ncbi:MAG: SPOR domain-containing protein [Candidatus Omnitrophota bacterium]|jgi:tetratricopeptide (TPR) repeat protein
MNKLKILTVLLLLVLSCQIPAANAESGVAYLEKIFLEGNYAKASEEASGLISKRARCGDEVYYIKGLSDLKLGKFADARKAFESLIDIYPRSNRASDAYLGIGDSYLLGGSSADALKAYNNMLEKFPNDKNTLLVRSRMKECGNRPAITGTESAARVFTKDVPRDESAGFITVQVGCFKNKRNAERVADKLSHQGFEGYVEIPQGPDKLYRVKAGKFQSSQEADIFAAKLKAKGYRTKICSDKK